ncbi:MAG: transglycosylase domain-containing protein, partial [Gammaproteobacteria bacterium]|nr:transglycosylase domain-containing protein [Gammaproteobacteria bacterium]
MNAWLRIPLQFAALCLLGAVVVTAVVTGGYYYVEPDLPSADELRDVRFQIPLSIYSRDGRLMQQYGEQKRAPVAFEAIPEAMIQAFLAAEDDRFFEHSGIDYAGIARGAWYFLTRPGERVPGGSTITQQVSRTANLMSRDYNLVRKFKEAILAFHIEREFTKEEILGLFLNTTFFGQRANGVAAAAQTYFNKELAELTLSEIAIIAGIPQGPSIMNPYNGPERAAVRRAYVLRRMFELGFITRAERDAALAEPILSQRFDPETELEADYVAQMAYEWVIAKFGKEVADTEGLKVTTTIDSRLQVAGNEALRAALEQYDRNHGYRGPLGRIDLETLGFGDELTDESVPLDDPVPTAALNTVLGDYPNELGSEAAIVIEVSDTAADIYLRSTGRVSIELDAVAWANRYLTIDNQGPSPTVVGDVLARGDIVRFRRLEDGRLELYQEPDVEGALVSVDPMDGAIATLVGGYSFQRNQYNRATQARRQPGSSFKPFFYLSALANGYTLASIVNDVCVSYFDPTLERTQCVKNYGGRYYGEVPVRFAIKESLNAAADRVIRDIGYGFAADYLERFGFSNEALPRNVSLALGSGGVTPLELAGAYAVLANGGYGVQPYFVQRVENAAGELLWDASLSVDTVCRDDQAADDAAGNPQPKLIERKSELYPPLRCAERVETAQRVFLITDVLEEVIKETSGIRANRAFPERTDLAGKTGTTNGPRDAWFAGFNAQIVAVVRVGFDDDLRDLGRNEQGGRTAIPAWIDF